MTGKFHVRWMELWGSLSKYMSVTISVTLVLFMVIRFLSKGFDYSKTFEHVSPGKFILFILGACVSCSVFSLVIALLMRMASITIREGVLEGRSYWGFKKQVPLNDIVSLHHFTSNGMSAIIVKSRYHGKIYISTYTERLDEIVEFLASQSVNHEEMGLKKGENG